MPLPETCIRVSRHRPCPICGKADWCLLRTDGSRAYCPRVQEGAKRYYGDMGWEHWLDGDTAIKVAEAVKYARREPTPPEIDVHAIMGKAWSNASTAGFTRTISQDLGVSEGALRRLQIGMLDGHAAFPMVNWQREMVGIRIRSRSGRKWAVTGSRQGLFVPVGFHDSTLLLIAEGPTDTAALLDLGFNAIGRPSCQGAVWDTIRLIKQRFIHVVLMADVDGPGVQGAKQLGKELAGAGIWTKIIRPLRGKDVRAWLAAGATQKQVNHLIDSARSLSRDG